MKKRLLSMLIVLTMVLSMLSVAAFAAVNKPNGSLSGDVYIALLNDSRFDGATSFPNEPTTSTGNSYLYVVNRNQSYSLTGSMSTFVEDASCVNTDKFWADDRTVQSGGGNTVTYGVADPNGLALSGDLLKNIEGNKIIQAWIDAKNPADKNVSSYRLIVYVVKYITSYWHGEGWHIDCKIVPANYFTLIYDANLPGEADSSILKSLPDNVVAPSGTTVDVSNASILPNTITVDYIKYTFLGWALSPNAKEPLDGNDAIITLNRDITVYAVWKSECTHDWGDWGNTTATCTEGGVETRECSICHETQTRQVGALGHEWGEWIETVAPKCEEAGEETRTCARCQETETNELDPIGHDYEAVVTAPTCLADGYTTYTCKNDASHTYVDDEVDALGHEWGEWIETVAPKCEEAGEETRTCARCQETETNELDPIGHDYESVVTAPTCLADGYTTYTCKNDASHTYVDDEVDALGHDYSGEWIDAKDGKTHYKECKRDASHDKKTADHVWGDWAKCEGDPLTEERICGDCGAKEYRDVDEKGKLDGGKETGDGIGDKYQVFVWYKAGANGSLTGEIYKAYTLGKAGDAELLKEVTLTYPTTVPYSGYAFDKWILPAQVTINGTTMSNFQVGTTYTFTATFGTDSKGNLDGDKETGDGTPDRYQVFVWYKADNNGSLEGKTYYAYDLRINGTTELRSTVSLNYPTPVARHGFDFDGWLEPADVVISEDTMRQFTVGETYVFTAMFSRDRGDRPVAEPTVKVKGLNSDDHVAYVVGRGEGMFDPMGKVTRAEVATIYFRLMTEEFRTEFWTDVNSFSDVVGTDWYNVAISTLENAGVIQDTVTGGEFRPNDPITRAELAVMAAQFATVTGKIPETSFKDVDKDYWAYDEIKLIECAGWIEGYRGYFRPDDNLTRAECVTIVNRMLKRGAEEDNMLEDMVIFLDNLDQDMWYYEAIQEAANSHDYTRTKVKLEGENFNGEIWTVLLDAPDWAALEQAWSQAHVE